MRPHPGPVLAMVATLALICSCSWAAHEVGTAQHDAGARVARVVPEARQDERREQQREESAGHQNASWTITSMRSLSSERTSVSTSCQRLSSLVSLRIGSSDVNETVPVHEFEAVANDLGAERARVRDLLASLPIRSASSHQVLGSGARVCAWA